MADAMVFSIPMRVRFRGITVREGMLIRGDAGWGEWSPFLEYVADEAAAWVRWAEGAAAGDWPEAVRGRGPVRGAVPGVSPEGARSWGFLTPSNEVLVARLHEREHQSAGVVTGAGTRGHAEVQRRVAPEGAAAVIDG